jgi:cytochrome c-type biogenesis protein CcmF
MALAAWLFLGALIELANRIALFRAPLGTSLARLAGLPRATIGMTLAHAGLGVVVAGIVAISVWKVEAIVAMKPGDTQKVGAYDITFMGEAPVTGPNYSGSAGTFHVTRDGADVTTLVSEKRSFRPRGMPTTEVGLQKTLLGDIYVVMGDQTANGARAMRLYFNPLVDLIWLGALLMFIGGGLSLADRRYRVGAPSRLPRTEQVPAE